MTAVDVFKEEGRKEGIIIMLVDMLRSEKSATLSEEVKDQLKEADFDTIERIRENYSKIESEDGLRRLLSK